MERIKNRVCGFYRDLSGRSLPERLIIINTLFLFFPLNMNGTIPYTVMCYVIKTVVPFLTAIGCCLFNKGMRKDVFSVAHVPAALAFCAVAVISPVINKNLPGIGGGIFLLLVMIYGFICRAYMTRKLFEEITEMICSLSVVSVIFGFLDFFITYSPDSEHRTSSSFFNANYYALIIEFVVILCVYKMSKYPYRWRKYLFIAFLNCLGILICKTRTAVIAIFVSLLFFFIFSKQWKPAAVCFCITALVVVGILVSPETLLLRYDSFMWSLNDRFQIWATAFKGLSYKPIFGQGLWAYHKIWLLKGGQEAINAHCIWLDTFLSFGIVGTSFAAYYFGANIISLKRQVHINAFYHEYSAVIALCFCTAVHCTTDLAITGVETAILAMTLFGMVGNGKTVLTE